MTKNTDVLKKAKAFIYDNARLLDKRRFAYFFEGGSRQAVISALAAYQNEDGGFGQALEPDIRCPQSQPVATEVALHIMDEINFFDRQIISGVTRYLESITLNNGGFPLADIALNDYSHAPWWTVEEKRQEANINPTGQIISYLLRQDAVNDLQDRDWFQKTVAYLWRYFAANEPEGFHDGVQWISFLQSTAERSKAEEILSGKIAPWLASEGVIEKDPEAKGYVQKVLDWSPTKQSYAAQFISEDEFERHLAHTISSQQEDGGWDISWPEVSPGSRLEWRGYVTVSILNLLRGFGKL